MGDGIGMKVWRGVLGLQLGGVMGGVGGAYSESKFESHEKNGW